jgi:hypothetical protein
VQLVKRDTSTAVQIALVIGALVVGVLLDRFVLAANAPARAQTNTAAEQTSTRTNVQVANSSRPNESSQPRSAGEQQNATRATGNLETVLANRDPRERLRELQAYIGTIPPNGFADALKRLRLITSSSERELASRLLIAHWVHSDPDGALQFAAGHRGYEYIAQDVFQQFAASDPEGALARAKGLPAEELRYRALRGVLATRADADPIAALELAKSLGVFRNAEPLTSAVYRQWAATDPQAAALHAAEHGQAEGWRSPVGPVVNTWAAQDPAAAANWSLSINDQQQQSRSLAQVMRSWARDDPQAAANWIYSLEPGASRDAAVAGLAQSLVSRDPQTALGWIATMSDEGARQRTLQRISGQVMWRDPQNGAELLQKAGLPADRIRDPRRWRERGGD